VRGEGGGRGGLLFLEVNFPSPTKLPPLPLPFGVGEGRQHPFIMGFFPQPSPSPLGRRGKLPHISG